MWSLSQEEQNRLGRHFKRMFDTKKVRGFYYVRSYERMYYKTRYTHYPGSFSSKDLALAEVITQGWVASRVAEDQGAEDEREVDDGSVRFYGRKRKLPPPALASSQLKTPRRLTSAKLRLLFCIRREKKEDVAETFPKKEALTTSHEGGDEEEGTLFNMYYVK